MKWLFSLAFALLVYPAAAQAQRFEGPAMAVDGDSLSFTGFEVRLFGIDAPEATQTCQRGNAVWACGEDAKNALKELVAGQNVICIQQDIDQYQRVVATCTVGRIDLGEALVSHGLAVAYSRYSDSYAPAEARARSVKIGLWGSEFVMPADYRAANPDSRPAIRQLVQASVPDRVAAPRTVYYANCAAARAAGAAPIYRGQPGYRPQMDGDNDGIACEPYRGRR